MTTPFACVVTRKAPLHRVRSSHRWILDKLVQIFRQRQDPETSHILSLKLVEQLAPKLYSPIQDDAVNYLLAESAYELETLDLHYGMVAALLELGIVYGKTEVSFTKAMLKARHLMNRDFMNLVIFNQSALDDMIDLRRDSYLTYPALRSLQDTFLLKDDYALYESPQHLWLRVALQTHSHDLAAVKKSYDLMSTLRYLPSSQTMVNAGRKDQTVSSHFALQTEEEDPDHIFSTLAKAARITRTGGTVSIGLQSIQAKGRTVDGLTRRGVGPVVRMLDYATRAFDKGFDSRSGTVTACTESWHADVSALLGSNGLDVHRNDKADNLHTALLLSDEFMKRVESKQKWTLFCPSDASYLARSHSSHFLRKYQQLERRNRGVRTVDAHVLWEAMVKSQIASGGPSLLFKDSLNEKSNENHVGTVQQTNACSSITQQAGADEIAVCTVRYCGPPISLQHTVGHMVLSLTRLAIGSEYPSLAAQASARDTRNIAIGVQGLADAFALMRYPYDSEEAHTLNAEIAEAIHYAALDQSCESVRTFGLYPSFKYSPLSQGRLQLDNWDHPHMSGRYDWGALREKAMKGTANALVTAYTSTSDTSTIANCSDSFEPFAGLLCDGNLHPLAMTTSARHLVQELSELGLWTEEIREQIIADHGSIKGIVAIPQTLRDRFKTVWDVDPDVLVSMSASRGPYICQSQSLSLYFKDPMPSDVSAVLFHAWKAGLKTGVHAIRTQRVHGDSPCDCSPNIEKAYSDCGGEGSCDGDGESIYSSDSLEWVEKGPLKGTGSTGTLQNPIYLHSE
ncbi:hypothetical protein FA13DRAFT_1775784 [Coprinellus micaceus]|uniref:Ribonucleoside-diphosphate reductase n=1 Tax=Coprinellus micaceus TaxID=71717 RepID=A0A4Y7T5E6_COPMI|nr:hypothetical protein FA13DRAFT_1775784 [Coprinellus micaceus]